jgi:hypothetical protein
MRNRGKERRLKFESRTEEQSRTISYFLWPRYKSRPAFWTGRKRELEQDLKTLSQNAALRMFLFYGGGAVFLNTGDFKNVSHDFSDRKFLNLRCGPTTFGYRLVRSWGVVSRGGVFPIKQPKISCRSSRSSKKAHTGCSRSKNTARFGCFCVKFKNISVFVYLFKNIWLFWTVG